MRLIYLFPLASFASAPLVSAVPSFSAHGYPSHPAEANSPVTPPQGRYTFRLWTKLRDSLIEAIWDVPKQNRKPAGSSPPAAIHTAPSSIRARYGDDVVLRFSIKSSAEVDALIEASIILFLDVWASTDEWVDIRLAKDVVPSLLGLLPASLQTAHVPLIHDLAQTVYESYPQSASSPVGDNRAFSPSLRPSSEVKNVFFQDYQPLSVIEPWMRLLASMFSTHVRLVSLGTSYEGRDIPAFRIGVHPTNSDKPAGPRKTIVIAGGAHAREWITVSTVNYVAYSLITAYGKSRPITKLIEEFDWVFVPTMNPDGYAYTWETDRLWRKNRQQTSLQFCPGIDLDRAWGFKWNGENTESNPCSESYAGDGPFQGIEAKQIADWVERETRENNAEFVGYLDLHSYSQQILYPYAFSCSSIPPTLENLEELAIGLSKAIRLTNREHYVVSSACEGSVASDKKKNKQSTFPRMESTGGTAMDWFYHDLRVRYAYQLKLRDRGSFGFLLPKENIVPTGKEVYNAIVEFGRFLLGEDADSMDWSSEFQRSGHRDTPRQGSDRPNTDQNQQDTKQDEVFDRNEDDHDTDDTGLKLQL